MFRQERRDVLPESIARIARQEQFPHARVDEAVARRTFQEPLHRMLHVGVLLRILPRVRGILLEPLDAKQAGTELARGQPEVIPPEQFEADGGGAFVLAFAVAVHAFAELGFGVFEIDEVFVDLARGDATEGEPGGEFGAEVKAEHAVASVFVGRHVAAGDEVFYPFVAGGFTAMKRVSRLCFWRVFRGVGKTEVGFQGLGETCNDIL